MKKYLNFPLCHAQKCSQQLQRGELKLCGAPLRTCPQKDKLPYGRYEPEDVLLKNNSTGSK